PGGDPWTRILGRTADRGLGFSVASANVGVDPKEDLLMVTDDISGGTVGCAHVMFGPIEMGFEIDLDVTPADVMISAKGIRNGLREVACGDLSMDGINDVALGAKWFGGGEAYVLFGPLGAAPVIDLSITVPDVLISAESPGDSLGSFVGIDRIDGCDALIVNASHAEDDRGRTYVFFGSFVTGASLDLSADDADLIITGRNEYDRLYNAAAADITGDGIEDLIVGAGGADPDVIPERENAGEVYVVDHPIPAKIVIMSETPDVVNVDISWTYPVEGSVTREVSFATPWEYIVPGRFQITTDEVVEDKAIAVSCPDCIGDSLSVLFKYSTHSSRHLDDVYLAVPDDDLFPWNFTGTVYRPISYPLWGSWGATFYPYWTAVALHDDTTIFYNGCDYSSHWSPPLQKGQVFQMLCNERGPWLISDLSGLYVGATAPIHLVAGHERTEVPHGRPPESPLLMTSLDLESCSSVHHVVPMRGPGYSEGVVRIKVCAMEPGFTTVNINDTDFFNLGLGECVETEGLGPTVVRGHAAGWPTLSRKIHIAQFPNSPTLPEPTDLYRIAPFDMPVVAEDQWTYDPIFYLFPEYHSPFDEQGNFIVIVAPCDAFDDLKLDGVLITSLSTYLGAFPFPADNSTCYTILPDDEPIDPGAHRIVCESAFDRPVQVYVYGHMKGRSYGYAAGMKIGP
ncbi:hypothetical protein ACFLU6_16260, partial [Acidobacteriota bacterium]